MKKRENGYIKVAAATPRVTVADCGANYQEIVKQIAVAAEAHVELLVFPELCITGYTCSDLFMQRNLLDQAFNTLCKIADYTAQLPEDGNPNLLVVVGLPMEYKNALYNVAAVVQAGRVLGIVPKTYLPTYSEFYEGRHFASSRMIKDQWILLPQEAIPFGTDLLFTSETDNRFCFGVEICEDLWSPEPPSGKMALNGATVIVNPSASNETIGKASYRRELVKQQSARLLAAYVYADAGEGESTTDTVYAGHNLIAENGVLLKESERFTTGMITAHVDLDLLTGERRRISTFHDAQTAQQAAYREEFFKDKTEDTEEETLARYINPAPFVPSNTEERHARCKEILNLQTAGLRKRLAHTHAKTAVIGISGGLDSTLALLVTVQAFDSLGLPREGITAITMPCFGTTDRTYNNAVKLCKELGVTLREIRIAKAVEQHFADIGHDINVKNVTYENGQARERTQILMDVANQVNGLVIGTGDLSELALGWATYNGDHMSMYGVNASVPKTLVRYVISYFAQQTEGLSRELTETLQDILDTPVSPELLPPENGVISQKTEDIVGPYELHDFFLYHMMRLYFKPSKIYGLAKEAFAGVYDDATIQKWITTFYRRFFSQQFKRSCLPDGPKVGSVSLSPRGDFRMPSDASVQDWMEDLKRVF